MLPIESVAVIVLGSVLFATTLFVKINVPGGKIILAEVSYCDKLTLSQIPAGNNCE